MVTVDVLTVDVPTVDVLTVDLLGAVEVRRDGVLVPLPAGKTTELLVRLALDAGVRVRAEALLDDLWGESDAHRNTLQSKVSQLRRALGDKGSVLSAGEGYTLVLDPDRVDAHRVALLAAEAAAATEEHDAALALTRSTEALSLFRGEVLVEQGDWATGHRARLEELRLSLLEGAMAARTDLGAGGELVPELEALVRRHPLRERLWVCLVTALYRSGRQADALAAYQRVRALLLDELGVEPGPALQDVETEVLRHSSRLSGAAEHAVLAAPGNLPTTRVDLVGRGDDVARVSTLLDDHRVVTVTGTAGVGKTALALAVAGERAPPGGVWVVRLESLDDTSSLRRVVAETLHVPGGGDGLEERLSGAETLLVLDNCEHLLAGVWQLLASLVVAVPTLRVLATSQVPLQLEDEALHQLPPLAGPDAVALFERRARALRGQLAFDADLTRLVGTICRSLDGLPLAIELAAARVRSMSVPDIARRLDDRFALLRDPSSPRTERRRALSGAIGWSYELLFPDDQRTLWALSCFAGSASLDAVEHVTAALDVPAGAVVDAVTRLVDRSLVEVDAAADGSVRYRLLDSIRLYAGALLERQGGTEQVRAAHAGWYAVTADWCEDHVRGPQQPACLAIARAERTNIDAALAHCAVSDPRLGARIAVGMAWTWVVLGDGTAGAARVRTAVSSAATVLARAKGHLYAGWLESSAGDLALAERDLAAARSLADTLADDVLLADVDRHEAFLAIQQGRPDRVTAASARSLAVYRERGLAWRSAGSLVLGAYGALLAGDTAAASRLGADAITLLSPIGDAWALVHTQALLGGIAQAEGRFSDAAEALRTAAETSAALGFPGQTALHLATLAQIEHRLGHEDGAVRTFERAITHARAGADGRLAATARLGLARLLRARGDRAAAVLLMEENRAWYARSGGGEGALLTRCFLHADAGERESLEEVLDEARSGGNTEVQVHALDALALHAAHGGDPSRARSLLAAADEVSRDAPTVSEDDRHDRRQVLTVLGGGGRESNPPDRGARPLRF